MSRFIKQYLNKNPLSGRRGTVILHEPMEGDGLVQDDVTGLNYYFQDDRLYKGADVVFDLNGIYCAKVDFISKERV